jgi:hypothetical protein
MSDREFNSKLVMIQFYSSKLLHTKFKVTSIDENARELKGISSREKSWHSDDSGPGENCGFLRFAKKIT